MKFLGKGQYLGRIVRHLYWPKRGSVGVMLLYAVLPKTADRKARALRKLHESYTKLHGV